MPFDNKKKPVRVGPPTYEQENHVWAIESAWRELVKVMTFVSKNHVEMKAIVSGIEPQIAAAKGWVLEH